jgi:hypothetical protein
MAISKASTSTLSNGFEKLKSLKTEISLPIRSGLIMWYDASNTASLTLSGSNVIECYWIFPFYWFKGSSNNSNLVVIIVG